MESKKGQTKHGKISGTALLSKFRIYELRRDSASSSEDPAPYKEERKELLDLLKYFKDIESLRDTLALTSADDYETCRILGEYSRMQAIQERAKRKAEKNKNPTSLLSY